MHVNHPEFFYGKTADKRVSIMLVKRIVAERNSYWNTDRKRLASSVCAMALSGSPTAEQCLYLHKHDTVNRKTRHVVTDSVY